MTTPTITITGPTGSGKTTLAIALKEALEALGFTVVNNDLDALVGSEEPERQADRLAALRQREPITIYTDTLTKTYVTYPSPYANGEVCS